jgi:hypothetical protein
MTENRISWSDGLSSMTALFAMFICAPAFSYPDSIIQNQPGVTEAQNKRELAFVKAEKLGDGLFKPGTAKKIQAASLELMRQQDIINTLLVMQAEHSFVLVEKNVDGYLDWYYSLSGEYMRLYKMVTGGELDDYMRDKLIEHLQKENPFGGFERSLQDAISQNDVLLQKHSAAVQSILNQNRITPDASEYLIVENGLVDKLITPSVHFDFVALRKRLLMSKSGNTLASSMTAAVTSKIMEKIDSKNILKIAAKSLAKFVTAKATGSLGGATAGAAVGSAIPGVGTAVGAVVGIVLGGIAIDKGLLKLEELMNRDSFKDEIMGAIADVRKELMETIKPEPSLFFLKN